MKVSEYPTPSEFDLQIAIRQWFTLQYPKVLMRCSMSGVWLPIKLAKKIKRLNPDRGWPDIFVAEPRGKYHGLYTEDLYAKNGEYRKTKHIGGKITCVNFYRG